MDKLTILIADDVKMNRSVIRKFFSKEYNVLEAADGQQTMQMIENNHIDAIILDIIMPEIDGLRILELLRANKDWDHIGVLVATTTKEHTERAALTGGADDIVAKPYDPIIIKKRLENILAKKALEVTYGIDSGSDTHAGMVDALKQQYEQRVEEGAASLDKIAKIMESSLDNQQMIRTCAHNLRIEAEKLRLLLK